METFHVSGVLYNLQYTLLPEISDLQMRNPSERVINPRTKLGSDGEGVWTCSFVHSFIIQLLKISLCYHGPAPVLALVPWQ